MTNARGLWEGSRVRMYLCNAPRTHHASILTLHACILAMHILCPMHYTRPKRRLTHSSASAAACA
ncbi:hypothetical protein FIBSPDRAFT_858473 [Athelia psychrophila]|uniref:Uncharacterized protein n=1 Tax=Athelia psychrophila TaxID=1759441 RepID=A0A166M0K3_9AGAM|nr:hypothetical protein FIBSPDRAFT_858473 [Fibularhizoctonia sp. CBS 109695]